jgi:hypothetical protein
MHAGSRSQLFYREHVVENMREWEKEPLKPHKAMNLAVSLNHMADYYWHEFGSDPSKVLGATILKEFRSALGSALPAFALIRDVADAHKHFRLSRPTRKLTEASQATLGALGGWDEAALDEGQWDNPDEIVVTYDDGSRHAFGTAAKQVRDMWRQMLQSAGLSAA